MDLEWGNTVAHEQEWVLGAALRLDPSGWRRLQVGWGAQDAWIRLMACVYRNLVWLRELGRCTPRITVTGQGFPEPAEPVTIMWEWVVPKTYHVPASNFKVLYVGGDREFKDIPMVREVTPPSATGLVRYGP